MSEGTSNVLIVVTIILLFAGILGIYVSTNNSTDGVEEKLVTQICKVTPGLGANCESTADNNRQHVYRNQIRPSTRLQGFELPRFESGSLSSTDLYTPRARRICNARSENIRVPFKKIIRRTNQLLEGVRQVQRVGVDGYNVIETVTCNIYHPNGDLNRTETNRNELRKNLPIDEIILLGTRKKEEQCKEEVVIKGIPYSRQLKHDKTLAVGTQAIERAGVFGERKVGHNVCYLEGNDTPSRRTPIDLIIKQPVTEIVRVGTKGQNVICKNQNKETIIPYKRIERKDPNLRKGIRKIIQHGVLGKRIAKYQVCSENGRVVGSHAEGEEYIAPKDEIILIGTREPVRRCETNTERIPIPHKTIRKFSDKVYKGETKVEVNGKDGYTEYEVKTCYLDDELEGTNRKQIRRVEPVTKVILIGTKEITNCETTTERQTLKYQTRYEYDDQLKKGSSRTKVIGKNGYVEYEIRKCYKYGKSTGAPSRKVIKRVEPVHEVIVIGTKEYRCEQIDKYEDIPYKTIYEYNNQLEKGKRRVKRKGEKGRKHLSGQLCWINGVLDPNDKIHERIVKHPVNEIVEIGTKEPPKRRCENVDKIETIPYKTKYEYDAKTEKGRRYVKQSGEKGSKRITGEICYIDNKRDNNRTHLREHVVKHPKDEIVVIGTGVFKCESKYKETEIPYKTVYRYSYDLPQGTRKVQRKGKKGLIRSPYTECYNQYGEFVGGKGAGGHGIERTEPIDEIVLLGRGQHAQPVPKPEPPKPPKEPKTKSYASHKHYLKDLQLFGRRRNHVRNLFMRRTSNGYEYTLTYDSENDVYWKPLSLINVNTDMRGLAMDISQLAIKHQGGYGKMIRDIKNSHHRLQDISQFDVTVRSIIFESQEESNQYMIITVVEYKARGVETQYRALGVTYVDANQMSKIKETMRKLKNNDNVGSDHKEYLDINFIKSEYGI